MERWQCKWCEGVIILLRNTLTFVHDNLKSDIGFCIGA